jgi:hypothetical protein
MSSALETWFGGVSLKLPPHMQIFYLSQGLRMAGVNVRLGAFAKALHSVSQLVRP